MKFEGEYLNWQRNGKGTEYDIFTGKIKFEGEYLNGQKNRKWKEYNEEGELEYEGECFNGQRNEEGKEYRFGKLIYKGEYSIGFIKN